MSSQPVSLAKREELVRRAAELWTRSIAAPSDLWLLGEAERASRVAREVSNASEVFQDCVEGFEIVGDTRAASSTDSTSNSDNRRVRPVAKVKAARAPAPAVTEGCWPACLGPALPPKPSASGYCYYLLTTRHPKGPAVICGKDLTCHALGGSWVGSFGLAPKGFKTLESAINRFLEIYQDVEAVPIIVKDGNTSFE